MLTSVVSYVLAGTTSFVFVIGASIFLYSRPRGQLKQLNAYAMPDVSEVKPGHGPAYSAAKCSTPECSNMLDYLQRAVSRNPRGEFLGHRPKDANGIAGDYVWQTYDEIYTRIQNLASGFMSLDMLTQTPEGNERVLGIYMKNRPEWVLAQYAAMYAGGFVAALYDTLGADSVPFILNQTQTSTVVCTYAELSKVVDAKPSTPHLKHIVICDADLKPVDASASAAGLTLWSMQEVEALGQQKQIAHITPKSSDIYCLIYTSGTTGEPKGVPLTHKNVIYAVESNRERMYHGRGVEIFTKDCVHFSYLPLAHSIEHLCEASMVTLGSKIAFYQGDSLKIIEDMALVRPTFVGIVPRLLNKIYDKIVYGAEAAGGFKAWLFRTALRTKLDNLKHGYTRHPLFDAILFSKIQKKLGLDRCRAILAGSAPVAEDVLDFFRVVLDFPVSEAYGLSETNGTATMNHQSQYVAGDVGPPLASCEIKLVSVPDMGYDVDDTSHGANERRIPVCGRGEVCFRGPQVFSGYYKRPDATAEAIDSDGWFHTGDIGAWTPDGRLKLIDRKKNIFKLSQGEYIAPERIENVLVTSSLIEQSYVYGDSLHAVLVAVIVPQIEPLMTLAKSLGVSGDLAQVCQDPKILAGVLSEIKNVSKAAKLFGFETVKAIQLIPEPFSVENNLLTPTFKLKRNECKKAFATVIETLYSQTGDLVAGHNVHQQ